MIDKLNPDVKGYPFGSYQLAEKIDELIEAYNTLELTLREHTHTVEVSVSGAFLDNG